MFLAIATRREHESAEKAAHSRDFAFDGLMALAQNVSGTKRQRVSFLAIRERLLGVEEWP